MADPLQFTEDDERVEERAAAYYSLLGISEKAYPELLEAAVAHARRPPQAGDPSWISVGPRNVGGRIISIAQDPTDPLILYAGSAHGGLWRTIDAGDSWEQLGDAEHCFPVGAIAIPESRGDILYIGTGSLRNTHVSGRGFFMVMAPGPHAAARYYRISDPPNGFLSPADPRVANGMSLRYHRIQVDPDDPLQFWVASQTGLWRCKTSEPVPGAGATPEVPPAPVWFRESPTGAPGFAATPITPPNTTVPVWPQYATDLRVARDPRKTDTVVVGGRTVSRYLVLYLGIDSAGVFRGRYDRSANEVGDWQKLNVPNPALPGFTRVLVALCKAHPEHVYAVMADRANRASAVYASSDNGDNWIARGSIARPWLGVGGQAGYDLVLEVNPDNPDILLCGETDLSKSENGGADWIPILQWQNYNNGDYAQHEDQHVAIFDSGDRRKIWAGNDGGLSMARDLRTRPESPGFWRKRSHGICAGQFQDITTHALYDLSFMAGGGLQDNGAWISYGGSTWYHIGFGDGAAMSIHAGNPRMFHVGKENAVTLASITPPVAATVPARILVLSNPVLADLPPGLAPGNAMNVRVDVYDPGNAGPGPFVPMLEQDPLTPGQLLIGWGQEPVQPGTPAPTTPALAFTAGPPGVIPAAGPLFVPTAAAAGLPVPAAGLEVSAVAFGLGSRNRLIQINISTAGAIGASRFTVQFWRGTAFAAASDPQPTATQAPLPGILFAVSFTSPAYALRDSWIVLADGTVQPNPGTVGVLVTTPQLVEGWIGTNFGQIFWTPDARPSPPGTAWTAVVAPAVIGGGKRAITRFAVHPSDPRIVAVSSIPSFQAARDSITIIIVAPGAVGTATFTYQIKGAPVSAAQITAARFDLPGTLTAIYFTAASYTANDTWAIDTSDGVIAALPNSPAGPAGAIVPITRPGGRVHITYDRGATWVDITHPPDTAGPPRPKPDLQALPPAPVTSLKFDLDATGNLLLYAGTLVGVYVLENIPTPNALAVAPASPVNLAPTGVLQLQANLTLSGLPATDATTQVDWTLSGAAVRFAAPSGQIIASGAAGTRSTVTARRGTLTATVTVSVAAGPVPAAPGPPPAFPAPAVNVNWRPFNTGLPLALVNDMELIAVPSVPPAVAPPAFRILRIATFGRGIWDCYLAGAASVFLYSRQTVIEDGRTYPRAIPAALPDDPRVPAGVVALDFSHAFDIRLDSAPFQFFDDQVDGVEFDEQLGADDLVPLGQNAVYVQVHNRGSNAADATVHLYFAISAEGAPLAPPPVANLLPPTLGAAVLNFTATFDPPGGSAWARIGTAQTVTSVTSAQPRVARFDWKPPATVAGKDVALLSLCSGPGTEALVIDPAVTLRQLIANERRAALRVVRGGSLATTNVYIRDGVDDQGGSGEFAFGGRSPDIICVTADEANPAMAFRDLLDQRPQDRITKGQVNHVYVRVFNKGPVDADAEVHIWAVPLDATNTPVFGGINAGTDAPPAAWIPLTPDAIVPHPAGVVTVPALGSVFLHAPWAGPPVPAGSDPTYQAYALVAIIKSTDNADPLPKLGRITSLAEFWKFFREYADSDNAALRVLRYARPELIEFDPPGLVDDLRAVGDPLHRLWSQHVSDLIDAEIRKLDGLLATATPPGRSQLYNPLITPTTSPLATLTITWKGFPMKFLRQNRDSRTDAWQAADVLPSVGSPRNQDEYLEWHVYKTAGKIRRIDFTAEAWDYWQFLAVNARDKVLDLYQTYINPPISRADLEADLFPGGHYNILNKWNTQEGAMHLTNDPNNLGAEITLVADATVLRKKDGIVVTDPLQLIKCSRFGEEHRSSDPRIGWDINNLAHAGFAITLENPIGLLIDSLDDTGFLKPDGTPVGNYWTVLRGFSGGAVRATYEVPAAEGFVVGDITIGGRKVEFGGQIAENVTMKVVGLACRPGSFPISTLPCSVPGPAGFGMLTPAKGHAIAMSRAVTHKRKA